MMQRGAFGLGLLSLLVIGAATVACSTASTGDDASRAAASSPDADGGPVIDPGSGADGGSSVAPAPTASDAAPSADAAPAQYTGANIDPDAAARGGDDSGPGGAPCNTIANSAPAIMSECSTFHPAMWPGGPLAPGTYYLKKVAVIADSAFCSSQFVPTQLQGTMKLGMIGVGITSVELAMDVAGGGTRHSSMTLTTTSSMSPGQTSDRCPAQVPATVPYAASSVNGPMQVFLQMPYGAGQGAYLFEKQ